MLESSIDKNLENLTKSLFLQGKKIKALKTIRDMTGWDLQKSNAYLRQVINTLTPQFPNTYKPAVQIIEERLPSIKNYYYRLDIETMLKCAKKDLCSNPIYFFSDWDEVKELRKYESDTEILEIVFSSMTPCGDVIVINDNLDHPLTTNFDRLLQDLENLSVSLLPFDMIFLWLNKPIITVVGHWGIYAHLQ